MSAVYRDDCLYTILSAALPPICTVTVHMATIPSEDVRPFMVKKCRAGTAIVYFVPGDERSAR